MRKAEIICTSLLAALVLTVISYFIGGVRYSDGVTEFPPIALQLLRNFVIYFAVFGLASSVVELIAKRRKK